MWRSKPTQLVIACYSRINRDKSQLLGSGLLVERDIHRTPDPILSSWPTLPHIPSPSAASEVAFKGVRSLYRVSKRWIWGELFSIVSPRCKILLTPVNSAKPLSICLFLSRECKAYIHRKSLSAKSPFSEIKFLGTLPFGGLNFQRYNPNRGTSCFAFSKSAWWQLHTGIAVFLLPWWKECCIIPCPYAACRVLMSSQPPLLSDPFRWNTQSYIWIPFGNGRFSGIVRGRFPQLRRKGLERTRWKPSNLQQQCIYGLLKLPFHPSKNPKGFHLRECFLQPGKPSKPGLVFWVKLRRLFLGKVLARAYLNIFPHRHPRTSCNCDCSERLVSDLAA